MGEKMKLHCILLILCIPFVIHIHGMEQKLLKSSSGEQKSLIQQMFELHQLKCEEQIKKSQSHDAQSLQLLNSTFDFSSTNIDDFKKGICALHWAKISFLDTFVPRPIEYSQITRLCLDKNNLKGNLPLILKDLINLVHVSLASNKLKEIPAIILEFPNLKILNLSHNKIRSIRKIGEKNLEELNLEKLDVTDNYIAELPFDLIAASSDDSQDEIEDGNEKKKKFTIIIAENPIVQTYVNQATTGQPFKYQV